MEIFTIMILDHAPEGSLVLLQGQVKPNNRDDWVMFITMPINASAVETVHDQTGGEACVTTTYFKGGDF